MKQLRNMMASLLLLVASTGLATDYTTFLTTERGFTEVTSTNDILGDADYYYLLVPAETNDFIVGVGSYEGKPDWASTDSKALRYKSAATDPVLDLSNFFTIEKSGAYVGLRNVVYDTDMFQTHDNAGYMYVNTFTDKTLDEWSQLTPTRQNGYWLFESGKYPISSNNWACGYLGPWNKIVGEGEPIALNRRNTTGDEAGHYRLFRITKNNLMAQRLYATILTTTNGFTEVTNINVFDNDPQYVYLITAAEQPDLFIGLGNYEAKPGWAGEDTKALRYRQAGNPVADLSNFFTIEKDGQYIGLRNVVEYTSLFQTHDGAGFMYVLTYTEPTLSDWCYLTPTYQNGYWIFENGKYPMSSDAYYKGYLGPWNNLVKAGEPIAANRTNAVGDEAGHYRLWRISRSDLFALMQRVVSSSPADMTWKVINPSFEQGESGWTLNGKDANGNDEFTAREYGMTGKAGTKLMNAYQWWAASLSVSQTVTNLPSGKYELSATVASWKDRSITVSANANTTTAYGVHADGGIRAKTTAIVGAALSFGTNNGGQLTINAGSTTDWWTEGRIQMENETQCFFKVDDVQLRCTSLYLDALAVRLPNNETPLVPGQWYYYETDYSTEYVLLGSINNVVYTTNGQTAVSGGLPAGEAAQRQMTLPVGRTYFKVQENLQSQEDATLIIAPYRNMEEGTFTAVALNVDGLPNKIATVDLNPDGPGVDGTKKISQYLASKNYDFIGCSEDFNYHGTLMSELNDNYSSGTVRKTLSISDLPVWQTLQGNFQFDTDGLNLIWKNTFAASNESWTRWNDTESTDGNQYVKKGYRHYDMWLGGNATIDVYVLHMDAGDTNATWARESQWRQLSDAINNSDHTRAKLIIGDTNSRYTREDVITNFINRISADFTLNDVWVEFYQDGIYPTTAMANLTDQTDPTDYAKYEIVDKIIYINPTAPNTVRLSPQSFRIEQDYTYGYVDGTDNTTDLGDHRPVVVTFKYQLSGAQYLVFADGSVPVYTPGTHPNVKILRNLPAGRWVTAVYPFAVSKSADLQIATLNSYDKATGTLNFSSADTSTPNEPFLMRSTAGATEICLSDVEVAAASATDAIASEASLKGTYTAMNITNTEKNYVLSNNTLYPVGTAGATINPYRAYIQIAQNAPARLNFFVDGEETTDISGEGRVDIIEFATAPVYNLNGQRVQNVKKGVFIQNGKKIVKK
ncbi:MAG: hypothetical protein IJ081_04390 [Prevotella sp.]|nr:hypothetical protein [Prevotella sp.]